MCLRNWISGSRPSNFLPHPQRMNLTSFDDGRGDSVGEDMGLEGVELREPMAVEEKI